LTDPGTAYTAVCPFYLIEHPEGLVVVDTGVSHEMLDAPAEYGPYGAEFIKKQGGYLGVVRKSSISVMTRRSASRTT